MSEPKADPLHIGQVVAGRYRVLRLLGAGGMGAVYEAEHVSLGNVVALKAVLPRQAHDAETVGRLLREARASAAIGHPGIVQVFDVGVDEGIAFLAMEKLEGEELHTRIQRAHPLAPAFVARVGAALADAIAAAHARGVVHRDLKPQNVFLARRGNETDVVKVLDFGIAKLTEPERADTPMTRTGQVMGTPLYMAPEQLRGAKYADHRADIYAIGAMLYETLTSWAPFGGESYPELVLNIVTKTPAPIAFCRNDVPPALIAIIERAMAKNADHRFQSALQLADALAEVARTASEVAPDRASVLATPPPSQMTLPEQAGPTPFSSSSPPRPREIPRKRSPLVWMAAAALVVVGLVAVVGGGGLYIATRSISTRRSRTANVTTAAPPVVAPAPPRPTKIAPAAVPSIPPAAPPSAPQVAVTTTAASPPATVPPLPSAVSGAPADAGPRAATEHRRTDSVRRPRTPADLAPTPRPTPTARPATPRGTIPW